jgi:hypothetical protein
MRGWRSTTSLPSTGSTYERPNPIESTFATVRHRTIRSKGCLSNKTVISLEEVCRRYELTVEEFLAWERAIDTHGVPGLRVTRLQIYRDNPPSRVAKPRC